LETNGKIKKQVALEDNALALRLFGEGGSNLRRLEKKVGVELNTRGSLVTISGAPENVGLAERLLLELYGLLEKGYPLYQHDLEYAIRMVSADPAVRVADVFMDAVYTSYRKKVIAPKSVAQKRYV